MTWFAALTGIAETTPDEVRRQLSIDGNRIKSLVNGKSWIHGSLETPTLAELRARVTKVDCEDKPLRLSEVIADVRSLHRDINHAHALFQVASQFNLLEMVSPHITPESGIGIYEQDPTQGPACAVACGAGTIFRNYLVPMKHGTGQSASEQIDCLADVGKFLGNGEGRLWSMVNGYAMPNEQGLKTVRDKLERMGEEGRDEVRQKLRIGLQWETEVTLDGGSHLVSQAYSSAMPIAYAGHALSLWAPLARLVLEAAYESTICAAILNARQIGLSRKVFLTLLGGGAFGNPVDWIGDAIRRAIRLHFTSGLEVAIVSHGHSNPMARRLIEEFGR